MDDAIESAITSNDTGLAAPEGKCCDNKEGYIDKFNWGDSSGRSGTVLTKPPAVWGGSGFLGRKSFYRRVFRFKKNRNSALFREYAARQATLPTQLKRRGMKDVLFTLLWIAFGWVFGASYWSIFLVWDYFASENVDTETNSNSTLATTVPSSSFEDTRASVLRLITLVSYVFVWMPIFHTISFNIYTNPNGCKIGKPWKRVAIIYLSHVIAALPLGLLYGLGLNRWTIHFLIPTLQTGWVYLEWYLLTRFLKFDWRVNIYWLPVYPLYVSIVTLVIYLPNILRPSQLKTIIVYISLITMTIEVFSCYWLKHLFMDHRDNIRGLAFCTAKVIIPLEILRYACFVLLWFELRDGAQIWDIARNVTFSIVGEIYSHTSLWQLCKNEIEIRLLGRKFDDFSEIYHCFSSIRSIFEYIAPALFTSNLQVLGYVYRKTKMIDYTMSQILDSNVIMDELWMVLLTYYLIEIFTGTLCWLINKLTSYRRLSMIGNLTWRSLFLMIIYIGMPVDIPAFAAGFLSVLTQP